MLICALVAHNRMSRQQDKIRESHMSYQHLTVERTGHVLTCGMANPPSHTLTAAEVQELHRLL
ncbi:MAG TPA: hypothetical protein DCF61_01800, partial [Alphaproteobacteria bacterium]|nr:hypothetical protein [Alphaproteobacteria bacterium]